VTIGELTTSSGFTGTITFSIDLIIDDAGGENGHFDHRAAATIDVNTSNEGITVDSHFNVSSASTLNDRAGTVTMQGGTTQEIRVQSTNELYNLVLSGASTIGELYDNLTVYSVTVGTGTTLKADAATRNYELWLNFSDTALSGFAVASAGTLDFDGDPGGAEGANITTAQASPPPTNYWNADVSTGDMTFNLDYATLSYGSNLKSGGTWNVQDCTISNFAVATYAVEIESGATITNFNDNTISSTTYGFSSATAHASFSNIVLSTIATTDIRANDVKLEFVNSNFDATQVNLGTTGDAISNDHNDVSNDYYIFATDMVKSAVTNDFATGDAVVLQMGKFMVDEVAAAKSVLFITTTTFQIGQDVPSAARTLTFDDSAGAGFLTASAGTLVGKGTGTYQMTITSAGAPPTNFWNADMSTGDPTVTMDYTTLNYGDLFQTAGTWDIDQCTFDNFKTSSYTVQIATGSTITSFNDNTLSNSAYGLNSQVAYTSFDNIVVSSMSTTDIQAEDVKLEFTNSNFDTSGVAFSTTGNIISDTHNDVANAYKIMATTLSKSSVTNDYATGRDVQLITGTFTIDEASASDDLTIDSGATLILNTVITHTFDSNANMTNSGVATLVGLVTSGGYYDLYNTNPPHIWLNVSSVTKADLNNYLGGFNYSLGSGVNSTMDEFIIETASTLASFNFTYIDFNNKASGEVAHWNVTQNTASERIKFLVTNLTATQTYEVYVDSVLGNTTVADGSGNIFFSNDTLTYNHIYITWVAGPAPDLTDFYWTGSGDGYQWDDETNWKGLEGATWWDPGAGDYPKSNVDTASFNESASSLYLVEGANSVITLGALTTTTGFTGTITFSIDLILDSAGGKNGSLNHKAVATIDVNTSNEQINMDGNLYISSSSTFTERSGTIVVQGATTQQIRVQSTNKLYKLTTDTASTIAELYDNLTVYQITIGASTTYKMDADTRGYELWTNFSDIAGCGFVSTSSGTLQLTGTNAGPGANITTADASPPPTTYWAGNLNSVTVTADYATFTYMRDLDGNTATWDVDYSTISNTHTTRAGIYLRSGATITSFTNNDIISTGYGLYTAQTHTAFDNIAVSSSVNIDIYIGGDNVRAELTNSNFDTSKVFITGTNRNIISNVHNDVANAYKVMATTLSKSAITTDHASGDDIQLLSGTYTIDEASASDDLTVDSGTTLVLNTGQTHTFDTDANLTNNGLLKTDGTITTGSGYFDFYTPGSSYLNNTTISNVDFNYYLGGFNFTVGRTANSTIADLTLEAPDIVGGDTAFNITSDTWDRKDSGNVWHMNITASSGTVKVCTVNLTNGETYRLYVDDVQEDERATSGDAWNFSYASWSTKHFNLTWVTSGPAPPVPPGPGQYDRWSVGFNYTKHPIFNRVQFRAIFKHEEYNASWYVWRFADGTVYESASPNLTKNFNWHIYSIEAVNITVIGTNGIRYSSSHDAVLDNSLWVGLLILGIIVLAFVAIKDARKERKKTELVMVEKEGI
jgi:hypothetical protein